MKVSQAKELFRQKASEFFKGYNVTYTKQSRIPKPEIPLVTLTLGNVTRPNAANYSTNSDGETVGFYLSKIAIVVDLFTKGTPIIEDGKILAYSDSSLDEILSFMDFINSQLTVEWCLKNDVTFLIEEDAQCLSDVINDTNYEYRSRVTVQVYFTQDTASTIGIEPIESVDGIDISEEE